MPPVRAVDAYASSFILPIDIDIDMNAMDSVYRSSGFDFSNSIR